MEVYSKNYTNNIKFDFIKLFYLRFMVSNLNHILLLNFYFKLWFLLLIKS